MAKPTVHVLLKPHHNSPRLFASRPILDAETPIGREISRHGIHLPFIQVLDGHPANGQLLPAQRYDLDTLKKHGVIPEEFHFDGMEAYKQLSRHMGTFRLGGEGLRYQHISQNPSSAVRHTSRAVSSFLEPGKEVALKHGDVLEFGPHNKAPLATTYVDLYNTGPKMMMMPFQERNYRGRAFTTHSGRVYGVGLDGKITGTSGLNGKRAIYAIGLGSEKKPDHSGILRPIVESPSKDAVRDTIIPHALAYGRLPSEGRRLLLITEGPKVQLSSRIHKVE